MTYGEKKSYNSRLLSFGSGLGAGVDTTGAAPKNPIVLPMAKMLDKGDYGYFFMCL